MYGDYEGIILASALSALSSYFAMWCILNNCLARQNVFKITRSNGIFGVLFLPIMKKYIVEYKKTYIFHSVMYCFSFLQITCFIALIVGYRHGKISLLSERWSFLYLTCAILLLGLDMFVFFIWDSSYDSQVDLQATASNKGRYLDDKEFNSREARTRLHARKSIYMINKNKFLLSKFGSCVTKRRLKLLACNMQSVQIWTEYLVKNDLYFSDDNRIQDIEFVSSEWKQIQYSFQQMHMKQSVEQYINVISTEK